MVNTAAETERVFEVGRQLFGADQVSDEGLPFLGAEDFCFYLHHVPGCFYFLGSGQDGRNNAMCHSADFDYNDALINVGITFWLRLVEQRMGVRLYA